MRKILIYITIALTIGSVLFCFFSTQKLKTQLEEPQYSSIQDKEGKVVISSNLDRLNENEIPKFISTYYKQEMDSLVEEQLLSEHPFQKVLYRLFLERNLTEDERLTIVMNLMYFDNGLVGLQHAADYYFNKKINKLSTLEQIFLIYKNENKNTQDIKKDLAVFIGKLEETRIIDSEEIPALMNQVDHLVEALKNSNTFAQSYIQLVTKELVAELDMTEADLFRKGYTIQTNLDSKIQTDLIQVFSKSELFPEHTNTFIEAGMAIIDYQSGGITGIVGGRNYHTSTFNRAIDTTRQPASTFKPLFVYGPAIDVGWKPNDKLNDSPIVLGNFTPKNYDYKYRGEVTLSESITMSYNVSTAWLLNAIGLETGLEYVDKFDLFHLKPEEGFKLAMGYTDIGTSPLALSKAYSVFPNEGVFKDTSAIKKVVSSSGKVVYATHSEDTKIYEKHTGKTMTSLLKEVVEIGTGKEAQVNGKQIAGKTGTTSYDGWFVGYDDRYVGTVWLGPDEVIPENRMNIDGGGYPATIFQKVFSELND